MKPGLTGRLLRGIVVLLPLLLTLYVVYVIFAWIARGGDWLILHLLPQATGTAGAGLLVGTLAFVIVGLAMSVAPVQRLYAIIEIPFQRLPMVRALYLAIKQLADYLSPAPGSSHGQVVVVTPPGAPGSMIGFITRRDLDGLPAALQNRDLVAVYLPMSYQIGGFTIFVPGSWTAPADLNLETAMRGALTGWLRDSGDPKATPNA